MLLIISAGDFNGKGHNLTQEYCVNSNFSSEEVKDAYMHACAQIGINFIELCCSGHHDNSIDRETLTILERHGVTLNGIQYEEEDYSSVGDDLISDYINLDNTTGFLKIYLQIVKVGNPNFEYEVLNPDVISIGGYGLFQE